MITGFCTAINPIDFTIWTSIVLLFGMMIGILLSSLFRFFTSSAFDRRSDLQNLLLAKNSSQHHYPMEMDFICNDEECHRIRRRSPDKEQWSNTLSDGWCTRNPGFGFWKCCEEIGWTRLFFIFAKFLPYFMKFQSRVHLPKGAVKLWKNKNM